MDGKNFRVVFPGVAMAPAESRARLPAEAAATGAVAAAAGCPCLPGDCFGGRAGGD